MINEITKENTKPKYGRLPAAMQRYGVQRTALERLASEAHAKIKTGGSVLYDFDLLDAYIDSLRIRQCKE